MKLSLIVLLLICVNNSLFACMSATQNRVFPIGNTSNGLCVVETHLNRSELKDNGVITFKPGWYGNSYLKIYDKNYTLVYSELIDSLKLFNQELYDSLVSTVIQKGIRLAQKFPDFKKAKPVTLKFCNFKNSAESVNFKLDTLNSNLQILLKDKLLCEFNSLYNLNSFSEYIQNMSFMMNKSDILLKYIKGGIHLGSFRQYSIGTKRLTVVHIAFGQLFNCGQGLCTKKDIEYQSNFSFKKIEEGGFLEPIIEHGSGFDLFIWDK